MVDSIGVCYNIRFECQRVVKRMIIRSHPQTTCMFRHDTPDAVEVLTIMDAISNAITDSCEPLIIPDISMRDIDGKTVIVAEILPGAQRPYFESMARLDEQQRKVLDMLVQNGPMESSSIADQLGVQKKTCDRHTE